MDLSVCWIRHELQSRAWQPRDVRQSLRAALGLQRICELWEVAREVHVSDRRTGFGKPKFHQPEGPLTATQGSGEEVREIQRRAGASDRGEVKETATREQDELEVGAD